MDSKKTIIIVIILLLLLGGGYFLYNSQNAQTTPGAASDQQASGGVFSSIKDALSKSLTLECKYPDKDGSEVTVYIKGGMVRMKGYNTGGDSQAANYGSFLMRDNKMYMWDDSKKEGIIIAIDPEQVKDSADAASSDVTTNQGADYLAAIEQYKDSCKTATVSDSMFAVPADVKFTDFGEQMKQIQNQMKDSGVDVEKMQQQYGQ